MTSYWSLCSNFIWKSNIVTCVQRNEIKEMNFTGPLRESVNCDGTSQKVSDTLIEVENSCRRITRPSIDRLNISKCVEWQEHKVERKAATVTPSVGCVTFTRYTDALASILLMIVRRHWVHRNPFHRFNKLIDQFGAFYRNSRKCRLISFVSAARTGPFSVLRFAYVNFKLIIRFIGLGFGLGFA